MQELFREQNEGGQSRSLLLSVYPCCRSHLTGLGHCLHLSLSSALSWQTVSSILVNSQTDRHSFLPFRVSLICATDLFLQDSRQFNKRCIYMKFGNKRWEVENLSENSSWQQGYKMCCVLQWFPTKNTCTPRGYFCSYQGVGRKTESQTGLQIAVMLIRSKPKFTITSKLPINLGVWKLVMKQT